MSLWWQCAMNPDFFNCLQWYLFECERVWRPRHWNQGTNLNITAVLIILKQLTMYTFMLSVKVKFINIFTVTWHTINLLKRRMYLKMFTLIFKTPVTVFVEIQIFCPDYNLKVTRWPAILCFCMYLYRNEKAESDKYRGFRHDLKSITKPFFFNCVSTLIHKTYFWFIICIPILA